MKNILVALDLTNMDDILLRYVSILSNILSIEQIHLMHAIEIDPQADEITHLLPDPDISLETLIQEEIESKLEQLKIEHKEFNIPVQIHIHHGDATFSILEWAQARQIDLIVLGKKSNFRGSGIFSGKIVRLSHTGVLFIPEITKNSLEKILVPIDFSTDAAKALEQALSIAQQIDAKVYTLHVYKLPTTYFPALSNTESIHQRTIDRVSKTYQKFLSSIDPELSQDDVPCEYKVDGGEGIASHIYEYALSLGADMIIIGSKGRTNASAFLIGSVAERLSIQDQYIPLMIVKPKERQLTLIKALQQL